MGGISIWQLLIIAVIVVLLFGTNKLRTLGSDLGASIKGFKKAIGDDSSAADKTTSDKTASGSHTIDSHTIDSHTTSASGEKSAPDADFSKNLADNPQAEKQPEPQKNQDKEQV